MASIRPNTFSGTWYIPGTSEKYKGELIHEESENFWALHFRDKHDNGNLAQLIKEPCKYIQGDLDNGFYILLINLKAHHAGGYLFAYDDYLLIPEYILEGVHIDSNEVILSELFFDFDDIVHWSGMCHFRYHNDGVEWERKPDIVLECGDHSLAIYPCRNGSMSFIPSREICLSQTVIFNLRPISEKSLEWFLETANRIKSLATLGIQRKVVFNELHFRQPKDLQDPDNIEYQTREHSLHINFVKVEETDKTNFLDHLFNFSDIKEHPEIYNAWMKNYEMMKPIIDLRCLVFLYPDLPPVIVFLNLMQALETYHARFICDKLKDYPTIIDHFIEEDLHFYYDQDREKYRAYLKENSSTSSITLKARIRYLFSIERFLYVPPANKCDFNLFIQKLIDSRNYYTHYNPKKEKKAFSHDELPAVNALISTILDYYILKKVDYPQEELISLIHEKFVGFDRLIDDDLYRELRRSNSPYA